MNEGLDGNRFIRISPGGHLRPLFAEAGPSSGKAGAAIAEAAPLVAKVLEAFTRSEAEGLFELAAHSAGNAGVAGKAGAAGKTIGEAGPVAELSYWRDFAAAFLTERCRSPATEARLDALPELDEEKARAAVENAPPMEGAEYLDAGLLQRLWADLDGWLRARALEAGGLQAFLGSRAPGWHQVGRVCFHLAENKKDPDYPFAFLATYAPGLAAAGGVRYQPLARALKEYAAESDRASLIRLLSPVSKAAEGSGLVRELLDSGDIYQSLAWTAEEAYAFLREIPLFEESGVLVRVPDWWSKRSRPRVSVAIGSRAVSALGADAVLDFDIGLVLDGEALDKDEIREILAAGSGLALLKGRWVEVDAERLAEALKHWKKVEKGVKAEGISFAEGMRLLAGAPSAYEPEEDEGLREWSSVAAGPWMAELLDRLRSPASLASDTTNTDLRATLRPYQEKGVAWLRLLSGLGLGACLADDMGLGKTVQILALLLILRKEGLKSKPAKGRKSAPSLLVMPASLLANWKAEIESFAPTLRARFVHPSMGNGTGGAETKLRQTKASETVAGGEGHGDLAGVDVVLTSYGMLLRQKWLETINWDLVVLDEAQAIKNPGSRQTKAVKRLKARARLALTGTPVENRLSDLWSLFDFLCPGLLGTASGFRNFVNLLEKREEERYAPLRRLVQPYILRRLKTDRSVIADLPDKTEMPAWCGLSKAQAVLYASITDEFAESLRSATGMGRRGLILATLMKLKQVCNHPSQLRGDAEWRPEDSGKFARLGELCEEIASRQDRVLVFTQFREITSPLASTLEAIFGRPGLVLHGGTPVGERQRLVKAFQEDDGPPFFVLSLKAGGTGLNLTAASHVIHFDRWWNPAVENQATDRAFRIGQKKNVLVHKFICRGTVEERIDALIGDKQALARDLLKGGGESLLTEMSDEALLSTLSLDLARAVEKT